MKVSLERLPESRVQLDIEVDADRLEKSLDHAYRRYVSKARVPGFRPGKAPRAVVERLVGREGLIREALDRLVPDVYNEALEAQDVDAIGQPELEIVEFDPVRFKATVPIRPSIDLGDYRSLRIQSETVEVKPEVAAEQMLLLRRRHATQVPVDRPAAWDDILIADVRGQHQENAFLSDDDAEIALREGRPLFVPGLAEAMLGMAKGDEKDLSIPMPDDFPVERLRGQEATFHIALKEVKEEQLPAEDDEFAQSVNAEEFPTIEALRQRIHEDLRRALQNDADIRLRDQAIGRLLEGATLEYPRILVDREIDHMIQDALGNDRQAYAAYLARVGRTEQEYREDLREAAEQRVRRSLVLSQLATAESLDVTDEEIEAELDALAPSMGPDGARFRQMFASPEGRASVRRTLLSRKTLDRLADIAAAKLEEVPA